MDLVLMFMEMRLAACKKHVIASYLCRRELHGNGQESGNLFARQRWERVPSTAGFMTGALPGYVVDLEKTALVFPSSCCRQCCRYRTQQPAFVLLLSRTERAHSGTLQLSTAVSPYLTLAFLRPIYYCCFQSVESFGWLLLTQA